MNDKREGPGFFSPYRHADAVRPPARYPEMEAMFAAAAPAMNAVLDAIQRHAAALRAFGGRPPEPRFEQDWFPRLDAAAAYALVRGARPRRIVEIGSGHSTRVVARALRDGGVGGRLTAIDPRPRADIAGIAVHVAALLGEDHLPLVDALEAGDILFVDSSHLLWPGSDVDLVLARLLPRLSQGVLVHIHDILLPWPYPPQWAWRGYTEQPGVAALLAGGGFDIVFASQFALRRLSPFGRAPVLNDLPLVEGALETSLWLKKTTAPVWR